MKFSLSELDNGRRERNADDLAQSRPPSTGVVRFPDLHQARILVVDDVAANVAVVDAMLSSAGFDRVTGVIDPMLACDEFRLLGPDLVILDLHMPRLDGIELLRRLRLLAGDDFVPIVVLTADAGTLARERALGAGATDFLLKPVDRLDLVLRVSNMLETRCLYKRLVSDHTSIKTQLTRRLIQERRLAFQADERRRRIEDLIGDSAALTMHYQPIVSLRSGKVAGFEALARFETMPTRPPDVWFADAAAADLGVELELHAVRRVGSDVHRLPPCCFITVNASPATVTDQRFSSSLLQFDPNYLVVELTEQSPMADVPDLVKALDSLRSSGVRIAVDDAGSGYAGLSRLMWVRPEMIKIDRSIVMRAPRDDAASSLITAIVQFASKIGSLVVAEGIELEDELHSAQDLGVDLVQGNRISVPRPLDVALTMVDAPPW